MKPKIRALVFLLTGLALGFVAGHHDAPAMAALHVEGTVQTVTGDGGAFAFTERDGTTTSFALVRPDGAGLVRPGAHLALTYIEVPGWTALLAVEPAP